MKSMTNCNLIWRLHGHLLVLPGDKIPGKNDVNPGTNDIIAGTNRVIPEKNFT